MDIGHWRKRIDEIDTKLAELLSERSRCVIEIGKIKREHQLPVYDPEREKQIFERVTRNNRGPREDEALRRLFERIIDESRRVERIVLEGRVSE
ncbi:MAG TPA: chorismate mutase [Terriglobia bacterium]|nr:chorismate mutase [Terriglobia bacterium]